MKISTSKTDRQVIKTLPDPSIADHQNEKEAKIFVATQWQLMWWRFQRHSLAMVSAVVIILIYLTALFCEFLAPFKPDTTNSKYLYAPPQTVHLWDPAAQKVSPYVYGIKSTIDSNANRRIFSVDDTKKISIRLFPESDPYKLMGFIPMKRKLFGPTDKTQPMFILGADRLGRDLLSRIIYGTRISMSIGFIGVVISLFLGILLGGISGYYGGVIDTIIQRVIEFLRSIPTIPLWMGLAAALPMNWPPLKVYFGITVILSLIGWTGLARVVRSRFLALRGEEFVLAAELDGASELRIIFGYMMPSFLSHIIASTTLAIPAMILSETSLSFLGLGLRPPIISWGVLLKDAQSVRSVLTAPWQLWPAAAVIIAVLALNFLGDGLRDASDPYSR
jgi:peptide/nickel transport system permease protein